MNNNVPTWTFMLIPAKDIEVNRLYQRDTHNAAINKIIRTFDYHLVNPVKVVFREGKYYAFDGQHTLLALRALYGDNSRVPCFIYDDIPTWCDEAALFETCNTTARGKKVTTAEVWKSRLNRGEPIATEIARICKTEGTPIRLYGGDNKGIRALAALEVIYNNLGDKLFAETIHILKNAWNCEQYSFDSQMLKGMAKFVDIYHSKYDRSALIKKLAKTAPVNILRAGKASVDSGSAKYAREILNVYNSGRQAENRLPDVL